MALFVDGPACAIDDLTDQDAGLLAVALNTGINLTTKIRLAQEEISTDLLLWLDKPKSAMLSPILAPWTPALHIDQIVVTPELKRWETMFALALVYRDAYFSELVDRFQFKWQEYNKCSRDAREDFIALGLPLVNDPVRQAGPPTLGTIAGPQSGGTFYASVSWVNAAGQSGAASLTSSLSFADGNLMTVSAPAAAPNNAVGFNVYAGATLDMLLLQNTVALAIGSTFTYVPGAGVDGELAGQGQIPELRPPMARCSCEARDREGKDMAGITGQVANLLVTKLTADGSGIMRG